jgi:hypothetical protein
LERWRVWQKRREPVKPIRRKRRLQIQVPETQSAFHPNAQRNAFRRRDVRQQSRSFAAENPRLRRGRIRRFYCGRIWIPAFNDRSDKRNPSFRLMLYRKRHCPLPKSISYVFGKFCLMYGLASEIGSNASPPTMLKVSL